MVNEKAFDDFSKSGEQAVQQTMKQAQSAMDNYFDWLQTTMSATPWGKTDLIEKWKKYTEKNMAATSDCSQQMSRAKDLQDVIQIQTEFMHIGMVGRPGDARRRLRADR